MNSPVPCLPDPIQNMTKNKQMVLYKGPKNKGRTPSNRQMVPYRAPAISRAPAAYGAVVGNKQLLPLQAGAGRSLVVQNFELIHTANGSNGAFSAGGDVCNPGIPGSYPWLSGIAKQYQKFRWKFLRYIYVPSCSTATAGSSFFMFNYDYYDAGPSTLAQVAASEDSSIGNAWFGGSINPGLAFTKNLTSQESIFVDYDAKKSPNPWYYVRSTFSGATPSTGGALGGVIPAGLTFAQGTIPDPEARPATIYYGSDSVAGSAAIGNLFVAYVCEFAEPVAPALNI